VQQIATPSQTNLSANLDGAPSLSPSNARKKNQKASSLNQAEYTFWDSVRIRVTCYWASFMLTGVMIPIVSSAILVTVYFSFSDLVKHLSLIINLDAGSAWHILFLTHVITLLLWLGAALVCSPFASAQSARPGSYGLLKASLCHLRAKLGIDGSDHELRVLEEKCEDIKNAIDQIRSMHTPLGERSIHCNQEALKTALASYVDLRKMLYHSPTGLLWAFGSGYCNAWRLAHQAEEAIIEFDCTEEITYGAMRDQMALQGSAISAKDQLLNSLLQAAKVLQPAAGVYLNGQQPDSSSGTQADPQEEAMARAALRRIRNVVNSLQDRGWEGLLRARNRLLASIAITGIATHVLLCITILLDGIPTPSNHPDPLVAATAFYLVGAVTGLFSRFYQESMTGSAVDDFGFSTTRLIATPLLSGLAGIGGVLLLTTLTALGGLGTQNGLELGQIFVVKAQFLLMAAVFGLTPNLLITGLQNTARKYESDIQSSRVVEPGRADKHT
jgi:hypothetical protein